jgi:hypothetical protein
VELATAVAGIAAVSASNSVAPDRYEFPRRLLGVARRLVAHMQPGIGAPRQRAQLERAI